MHRSILLLLSFITFFAVSDCLAQNAERASGLTAQEARDVDFIVEKTLGLQKQIEAAHDFDAIRNASLEIEMLDYLCRLFVLGLEPRFEQVKMSIAKLGPEPSAGQPPEPDSVTGERRSLIAASSKIHQAINVGELCWVRARESADHLARQRPRAYFAQALRRDITWTEILQGFEWRALTPTNLRAASHLKNVAGDLIKDGTEPKRIAIIQSSIAGWIFWSISIWLGLKLLARTTVNSRFAARSSPAPPHEAASAALWYFVLSSLPMVAAVVTFYIVLLGTDALHPSLSMILFDLLFCAVVGTIAFAAINATVAPLAIAWRPLNVDEIVARRLSVWLRLVAGLYAVSISLEVLPGLFVKVLGPHWSTCFQIAVPLILAVTLIFAGRAALPQRRQLAMSSPSSNLPTRGIVTLVWLAACISAVATLAGYISFARLIAHQIVQLGVLVCVGALFAKAAPVLLRDVHEIARIMSRRAFTTIPLRGKAVLRVSLLCELAIFALSIVLLIPFLLLQAGYSVHDIWRWMRLAPNATLEARLESFANVAIVAAVVGSVFVVAATILRNVRSSFGARWPITLRCWAALCIWLALAIIGISISLASVAGPALSVALGPIASITLGFALGVWSLHEGRQNITSPAALPVLAPRNGRGSGVFISYRRADSLHIAGRIYDHVTRAIGVREVFFDVASIPVGVDFRSHIRSTIQGSAVILAIIGPRWIDKEWRRWGGEIRDRHTEDFVEIELEEALAAGVPIIPILVDGAEMPPAAVLTEALRNLPYANALSVRAGRDFANDMDRVCAIVGSLRKTDAS